ncbi:hypothetical protein D3C81_1224660 [compost metagenome]
MSRRILVKREGFLKITPSVQRFLFDINKFNYQSKHQLIILPNANYKWGAGWKKKEESNTMEISPGYLKLATRLKSVDGVIKIDDNNWDELKWALEDEKCDFMLENEVEVRKYAKDNDVSLRKAVEYLFEKERRD